VDPWLKIAQTLQKEHGYEPVYWIGYEYDGSRTTVPRAFPEIIYHPYFDAWKGIFPREIADNSPASFIDMDFLKENASYELQAIKMMDRMDADRYSFNFMERQRHFRNLVKYWTACIDRLKPDLVVSMIFPHQLFDYVLYLLCRFRKIRFVTFCRSAFPGRVIPLTDVASIGRVFDRAYAEYRGCALGIDQLKSALSPEIITAYEKMKLDYASSEPPYMKKQLIGHGQNASVASLARKFIADMVRARRDYFGAGGHFTKGIPSILKQRRSSIESSRTSVLQYARIKLKSNAYKKKLRRLYDALAQSPDLSVPYIIFNLHYQPEMTSSPSGDMFVDQRLCVEVLARHAPAGHLIYVKEHPSQFYAHVQGHTSRIPEFYRDLAAYPQVRLVPMGVDPFSLIRNSRAVATITGTSGWEGMAMGKPVIIFGTTWYEKYSGVLRVVDEASAGRIPGFIADFAFDERDLLAYLSAFQRRSLKVYAQRSWDEVIAEDKSESVPVFAASIVQLAAHGAIEN
jgi:hypothetical protein